MPVGPRQDASVKQCISGDLKALLWQSPGVSEVLLEHLRTFCPFEKSRSSMPGDSLKLVLYNIFARRVNEIGLVPIDLTIPQILSLEGGGVEDFFLLLQERFAGRTSKDKIYLMEFHDVKHLKTLKVHV